MSTREQSSPTAENAYGNMSEALRERLLDVNWGAEYHLAYLALTVEEETLLTLASEYRSPRRAAIATDTPDMQFHIAHCVARGKAEAQAGLSGSVLALPTYAQRVILLNDMPETRWDPKLILVAPEVLVERTDMLDDMFGLKWRKSARAGCSLPIETIRQRSAKYDAEFGPLWRNSPIILSLNPDTIDERIDLYDRRFGRSWRAHTTPLTNRPQTVLSSARALQAVDITQENTATSPYFLLLTTTVANKRRKIITIRQDILGHQQAYETVGSVRLSVKSKQTRKTGNRVERRAHKTYRRYTFNSYCASCNRY